MHTKSITKLLALAAVSAMTFTSSALTITEAEALGSIAPATPSGDGDAPELVRFMVVGHNANNGGGANINFNLSLGDNGADSGPETYTLLRTYAADLPLPIVFGTKNDNSNSTINNLATYQYVLGKYGQDALVWYIGDLAQDGTLTLPGTAFGNQLSHTTFFNRGTNVPDGGATAALLGLGVLGLAAVRRKS